MRRSLTSRAARLAASASPAGRLRQRAGEPASGAHELAAGSREAAADATNVSERTETAAQRAVGAAAVLLRVLGYRLLVGHGGRF